MAQTNEQFLNDEDEKPRNVTEAVSRLMRPKDPEPAEALDDAHLDDEDESLVEDVTGEAAPAPPAEDESGWQDAAIPQGMALPGKGRQVTTILLRAAWTDAPELGDRTCVLWNLNEADEKFALARTRGVAVRTIDEMAKQTIRAFDGKRVDWTRGARAVDRFWSEIGAKCRTMLKNLYLKNHVLKVEEQADFFTNCIAVRTVDGSTAMASTPSTATSR